MESVRRNDPCPCGSGLKYKRCCLAQTEGSQDLADNAQNLRAIAFKAMSQEKWEEAIRNFKLLLEDAGDTHVIMEAVGSCYDGLEDYLRAAEYYEKALGVCPDSRRFDTLYRLGVARGCAARTEKALDAFRCCLELCNDSQAREHIQKIICTFEEIQQGIRHPDSILVQAQLQRAFSDMEAENYPMAAARLEKIAGLDPKNPAIFYNLGVVYTFLKREEEALAQFRKSVELYPDYFQAWYNMGQICMIKNKDYSQALNCFDRAAGIQPDYVGAHHQKGVAWELLGDKKKALACWKKTLDLDPNNQQAKANIERLGGSVDGS